MECYTYKKYEILSFATTWVVLEIIKVCKLGTERQVLHDLTRVGCKKFDYQRLGKWVGVGTGINGYLAVVT